VKNLEGKNKPAGSSIMALIFAHIYRHTRTYKAKVAITTALKFQSARTQSEQAHLVGPSNSPQVTFNQLFHHDNDRQRVTDVTKANETQSGVCVLGGAVAG
jgi:hypothetical protein